VEAVARLYFDHPVTLRVVALAPDRQDVPPSLLERARARRATASAGCARMPLTIRH